MNTNPSAPPPDVSLNGTLVAFAPAPDFPLGTGASGASGPDPFDVNRLRLQPDDDAALGVRELLVTVPYKKPSKEQFVRVHRDSAFRCTGGLIELKDDDSEAYWVDPSLWPHLAEEPTFEAISCHRDHTPGHHLPVGASASRC